MAKRLCYEDKDGGGRWGRTVRPTLGANWRGGIIANHSVPQMPIMNVSKHILTPHFPPISPSYPPLLSPCQASHLSVSALQRDSQPVRPAAGALSPGWDLEHGFP